VTRTSATALRTLLLCEAVLTVGVTLSFPFMTLYLHVQRGLPMGAVGLCVAGAMAASAAGQGVGGELADMLGCKRVMAGALAARAGLTALMAAAVAGGWSVPAVVGLHVSAGLLGNCYDPAVRAWIAHEHPADGRVRAYGLLRTASNAAWAVGPAIGGFAAARSYAALFGATSVLCALCLVLLLAVVPEAPAARTEAERAQLPAVPRDARFLTLCALSALLCCVMGQLVVPMSAHATAHAGITEPQLGLLFMVNGTLVVLLQHAVTGAVSGRSLARATALGSLFYAAGWSCAGFARGWWPLAAGVAIATVGETIVSPCMQTLAANLAPAGGRGRYLGFQGLMTSLGLALGPALGGFGQQRLPWPPAPWLAAAGLAVIAAGGFALFGRRLTAAELGMKTLEVS
jgi:MFS family permease